MANLSNKIKLYANREIDFLKDVILKNDAESGGKDYIAEWNLNIAKPTEAQLNALEEQANIVESNQAQVQNRIKEYGSIAEQIEYITENGIEAWQTKVNSIKAKYPKENN
jgi:hypothetical protein